ncbi:hypothetical protein ABIA06_006931 [Bradyrhizobium yuanmingense]
MSKPENYGSGIENKMPTYSGLKSARGTCTDRMAARLTPIPKQLFRFREFGKSMLRLELSDHGRKHFG